MPSEVLSEVARRAKRHSRLGRCDSDLDRDLGACEEEYGSGYQRYDSDRHSDEVRGASGAASRRRIVVRAW